MKFIKLEEVFVWKRYIKTIVFLCMLFFVLPNKVYAGELSTTSDEIISEQTTDNSMKAANIFLDVPSNIQVNSAGDLILKLEWTAGTIAGTTPDKVRYLIYRSEEYGGSYEKIGYSAFNATNYYDGGGSGLLEEGKTYFYKVQAYEPESNSASNLYNCSPGSGIVQRQEPLENEFSTEETIVRYLREQLIKRDEEIEIIFWQPSYTAGYHKTLYNMAVEEKENLQESSSVGDYFKFHIKNFDADFEDLRTEKNGLKKYRLRYRPDYYTNASEEQQLEREVNRLVYQNGLGVNQNSSDIEKVKAVYEYLSTNSVYDLTLRNNKGRCSAYDALIQHKAVCQGFANATYKLLRELGVMNRIVKGEVFFDGQWRVHAWNLVKIANKWYHVDPTTELHFWDEYSYVSYKWFLKSDKDLEGVFRKDPEDFNQEFEEQHPIGTEAILLPISDTLNLEAQGISSTTISLSWNRIMRATNYELYRATAENGQYKVIKDIAGRATADKDIVKGTTYYYKVRAYELIGARKAYSEFSQIKPALVLETPILSTTSFKFEPEGVRIVWKKTAGATHYDVFRSDKTNQKYVKVGDMVAETSFMDRSVKSNEKYYYKIKPCNVQNGSRVYGSFSNEKTITTYNSTSVEAQPSSGVTIKLNWSDLAGLDGYSIYRSDTELGEYKYVKSTTGLSTSDTGLRAGTRYYYKVAAFKNVNGEKQYTLFSNLKAVVTLATPRIESVQNAIDGVELKWSKASGAERYNIYRAETKEGKYEYVESVLGGNLNWTDKNAISGKMYYYKVRPYKRVDGVVYYGGYSQYNRYLALKSPTLLVYPSSGVTMRLNWNRIDTDVVYEIYGATSADGNYSYIKSTTGNSTADVGKSAGNRYFYKIRTYKQVNNVKYYSYFSKEVAAVALAQPSIKSVVNTENGMVLEWSKASGAERYNVYRCDTADGKFEYVESVLGGITRYADDNVQANREYYYKVRAYKRVDGIVYYGLYSEAMCN